MILVDFSKSVTWMRLRPSVQMLRYLNAMIGRLFPNARIFWRIQGWISYRPTAMQVWDHGWRTHKRKSTQ